MIKKILILAVMSIPMTVSAENWLNISDNETSPYYFDMDSIKSRYSSNGDLIVGMWTTFPNPSPIIEGSIAIQMLNYANCTEMSIKHAEMLELDVDGNILWRLSQFKDKAALASVMPLDYYYPKPNSDYTFNLELMCAKEIIELGFLNAGA